MEISKTFNSQTKKNPHIQKHFIDIWNREDNASFSEEDVLRIFSKLKIHHNLLKNRKIHATDFSSFEKLEDTIEDIVKDNKVSKLYKSLFSNKYKHLTDIKTLDALRELVDNGIEKSKIAPYLGKMAAFKHYNEVNSSLLKCLHESTETGINVILKKVKEQKLNVDVALCSHKEKLLILKINDYKASKALGSSNWCISYSPVYFKQYTLGKHNRGSKRTPANQFFVFDFNYDPSHPHSLIGITVNDKKFIFAADKRDRSISFNLHIDTVMELNKEKYYTNHHYLTYLQHSLQGQDYKAFEFFKSYVESLDTKDFETRDFLKISQIMDSKFKTKSLKRQSKRFLSKLISRQKKQGNVSSEVIDLISEKNPAMAKKMKQGG
jgi:hypothetical protein